MRDWNLLGIVIICLSIAGCATAARYTLEDRFQAIGIPEKTSVCMVDELDESLNDNDLTALAKYTTRISRASSTTAAIQELVKIDNPRAVAAIGQAGFTCVTGFGR
ncbi:MAG: hypothetical protein AAF720_05655 [Pseudomonadota bacterium]